MHRSAKLRVSTGLLATWVALAAGATAGAQSPAPQRINAGLAFAELARAGVKVPREALRDAYLAYIEGMEQATLDAISTGLQVYGKEGTRGDSPLSVQDARRVQEIERVANASSMALQRELYRALAEAASPEDRAIVEAAAVCQELQSESRRFQGATYYNRFPAVDDLGAWLVFFVSRDAGVEEQRRVLSLAATEGEARIRALREARARILEFELDAARTHELTGMEEAPDDWRLSGRWDLGRYTAPPVRTDPDSDIYRKAVAAQLRMYRAVRPHLSQADVKALMQYWAPRLSGVHRQPDGLPELYAGSHRVGVFVSECLRCPGLSDESRNRVREIGRAWVADDDALIAGALEAMAAGRPAPDLGAERATRAAKARAALAQVPGLEWLRDPQARFPTDLLPVSEEDGREFGMSYGASQRQSHGDGEEAPVASGLPVGYSRALETRLALALRLTPEQQPVLASILQDAREMWRQRVTELAIKATAAEGHTFAHTLDGPDIAKVRAAEAARDEAWKAARALDIETFNSIQAALGPSCDHRVLQAFRALRESGCVMASNSRGDLEGGLDVASRVLDTPMSSDSRSAAIKAMAPLLESWHTAIRELDSERTKQRLEQMARSWGRGDSAVPEKLAACMQIAAAIEEVVLDAVAAEDRERLRMAFLANRRSDVLADPVKVWAAVESAVQCAPADERDAIQAAVAPVMAEYEARWKSLAEAAIQTKRRQLEAAHDTTLREIQEAARDASRRLAVTVALRLDGVLPKECWPPQTERGREMEYFEKLCR